MNPRTASLSCAEENAAIPRPRTLENIRVVDFSWVRAGPWATRWLGAFGAEIIKIEWPENERGRLPSTTTPLNLEVNLNTSGNFNDTNVNKKSLSLNVRSAKGLEIVKRLIAISDIVIENFSSRVLQTWGLGYEELCKIKPNIVYVSMSGYGHTGRHHHYTTFGPIAQAVSGLTYLSGLPDKPPAGWGWPGRIWMIPAACKGAMCALTGLYHRNMTGHGQHIDLSQMVSSVPQWSGADGLHGEQARVAPGWLSSWQPGALARHASGQQLPRANRRSP
jgi:crotonobetainyl-CoA:carnitine CoA-transferase CaiB-like acyl-CoA transferase